MIVKRQIILFLFLKFKKQFNKHIDQLQLHQIAIFQMNEQNQRLQQNWNDNMYLELYQTNHYQYSNQQNLIKLRQMNAQFTKLNQQYLQQQPYQYKTQRQSFHIQNWSNPSKQRDIQNLNLHENPQHHRQTDEPTDRSNSLLFTLSQKDDQQTKITNNNPAVQHLHPKNINYSSQYKNNFANFNRYQNQKSFNVNNTVFQSQPQHYHYQITNNQQEQQLDNQKNAQQPENRDFSKYAEFSYKISKLFNIRVEDLQLLYNELLFQRQIQNQKQNQFVNHQQKYVVNDYTDSEVMKKLFQYALQIKKSHNQLKNMITDIDNRNKNQNSRIINKQKSKVQSQIQNVSINFMLQDSRSKVHYASKQLIDQEQRTARMQQNTNNNKNVNFKRQVVHPELDSKQTIINSLMDRQYMGSNHIMASQITVQSRIQSIPSQTEFELNNQNIGKIQIKAHKKSKVSEKIRMITQQLQSLKHQIDHQQSETQQINIKKIQNQLNETINQKYSFRSKKYQTVNVTNNVSILHSQIADNQKKEIKQTSQFHKKVNNQNTLIQKAKINKQKQTKNVINAIKNPPQNEFGQSCFIYKNSIQQIQIQDDQINKKIMQTIKSRIVKSPSKKYIEHSQQIPTSKSKIKIQQINQTATLKYSGSKSAVSNIIKSQPIQQKIEKSQKRIEMFKKFNSRKQSQDKNQQFQQQNRQSRFSKQIIKRSNDNKTSNQAYMNDSNIQQVQVAQSDAIVTNKSKQMVYQKMKKPTFISKHIMKNGKLILQSQNQSYQQVKMISNVDLSPQKTNNSNENLQNKQNQIFSANKSIVFSQKLINQEGQKPFLNQNLTYRNQSSVNLASQTSTFDIQDNQQSNKNISFVVNQSPSKSRQNISFSKFRPTPVTNNVYHPQMMDYNQSRINQIPIVSQNSNLKILNQPQRQIITINQPQNNVLQQYIRPRPMSAQRQKPENITIQRNIKGKVNSPTLYNQKFITNNIPQRQVQRPRHFSVPQRNSNFIIKNQSLLKQKIIEKPKNIYEVKSAQRMMLNKVPIKFISPIQMEDLQKNIRNLPSYKTSIQPIINQNNSIFQLPNNNIIRQTQVQPIIQNIPINNHLAHTMNNSIYNQQGVQSERLNQRPIGSTMVESVINRNNPNKSNISVNVPLSPRMPQHMRPPKYIAPKDQIIPKQLNIDLKNQLNQNSLVPQKLQRSNPKVLQNSMSKVLQNSKSKVLENSKSKVIPNSKYQPTKIIYVLENLPQQNFQLNQQRSDRAMLTSEVHARPDLYQTTPSFGQQSDYLAKSFHLNTFNRDSSLNKQRQPSRQSNNSVTSRSKSTKKGINLQSKKKQPTKQVYQSSYLN